MNETKFDVTITRSRKINLAAYGGPQYETEDLTVALTMKDITCPPADIKKVTDSVANLVQKKLDEQVDVRQKAWLETSGKAKKKEPTFID